MEVFPLFCLHFKKSVSEEDTMAYNKNLINKDLLIENSKNENLIKILKNKLKLFGLNPKNWKLIQAQKSHHWYIVNMQNKSHCLKGVSSFGSNHIPYWKDIEVNSF